MSFPEMYSPKNESPGTAKTLATPWRAMTTVTEPANNDAGAKRDGRKGGAGAPLATRSKAIVVPETLAYGRSTIL